MSRQLLRKKRKKKKKSKVQQLFCFGTTVQVLSVLIVQLIMLQKYCDRHFDDHDVMLLSLLSVVMAGDVALPPVRLHRGLRVHGAVDPDPEPRRRPGAFHLCTGEIHPLHLQQVIPHTLFKKSIKYTKYRRVTVPFLDLVTFRVIHCSKEVEVRSTRNIERGLQYILLYCCSAFFVNVLSTFYYLDYLTYENLDVQFALRVLDLFFRFKNPFN